jgi:hypothetical protein
MLNPSAAPGMIEWILIHRWRAVSPLQAVEVMTIRSAVMESRRHFPKSTKEHATPWGSLRRPAPKWRTDLEPFVERSVNEIIAERMNKKQMHWNRATVQPVLEMRMALSNDTLENTFRRHYPGFRHANGDEVVALVA